MMEIHQYDDQLNQLSNVITYPRPPVDLGQK